MAGKKTHLDKKASKELEHKIVEEVNHSPSLTASPLGPLSRSSTRKLLIDLITTMNASFPDYDFRQVTLLRSRSLNVLIYVRNLV